MYLHMYLLTYLGICRDSWLYIIVDDSCLSGRNTDYVLCIPLLDKIKPLMMNTTTYILLHGFH